MCKIDVEVLVFYVCVVVVTVAFFGFIASEGKEVAGIQKQAVARGFAAYDEKGEFKWKEAK